MTNNGYIKLHRQITEWGWYKDPNTLRVFLHLLLKANYTEAEFMGHKIKPGQVVIGRKALAEELEMTERQIRTSLVHLKTTNEVTIKTTNKFSIVTIENWDKYQVGSCENDQQNDQQSDQQVTNKRPQYKKNKKNKNIGGTPSKRKSTADKLKDTYAMMEEWANEHE